MMMIDRPSHPSCLEKKTYVSIEVDPRPAVAPNSSLSHRAYPSDMSGMVTLVLVLTCNMA